MLEVRNHKRTEQGEGRVNDFGEVDRAIDGFRRKHGMTPVFHLMAGDARTAYRFVIPDESDREKVRWEARGGSVSEAIAKLERILEADASGL